MTRFIRTVRPMSVCRTGTLGMLRLPGPATRSGVWYLWPERQVRQVLWEQLGRRGPEPPVRPDRPAAQAAWGRPVPLAQRVRPVQQGRLGRRAQPDLQDQQGLRG